ncbi:MAG TPA: pitrilysin family protein [Desulfobacteria bacterium]|nr:pitrilysin family protein [Desulfobacteria bacterium]
MYNKTTLSNGVRIVTEEIPHVRSACLGFWVGAGSRDENDDNSGIAHFIEHMMFKGTEKRTAKQIAEALDAVGGQLNAFTSKEYTCYYARVLDEHLDIAVDLLSDMFFNSLFREEDIDKEKNVIIEEIKMYEDAPDELVHDIFASTLWSGHALGKPIIGTEEIIKRLGRENLMNFKDGFYSPASLVVSVAGNVKHEEIVEILGPMFEKLRSQPVERRYVAPKVHSSIQSRKKDTEQVHLCIGTPGLPMDDRNTYVLHILNSVLGGGISSRLFQEIREERGLAYSVYTYQSSYRDAGLFSVYAGLSQNNLNEVISLVAKEMKDFRLNGITKDELDRAKQQIKGSMYLGLENVSNRMSRIGKSELCLNRIVTVDEAVQKINDVSLQSVKDLADYMFKSENIVVTSIGPEIDSKRLAVCLD